jgi:glutamate-5-semialdehyde dehydrogenase
MPDLIHQITAVAQRAKKASRILASAPTAQKNQALSLAADLILQRRPKLLLANQEDIANATTTDKAFIDRLTLTTQSIQNMHDGLKQIVQLPDPVGEITDMVQRPSGIQVGKMRAPLGVVGIIYESRPNVTADAAALCLKSGNACILRGGSECLRTNQAITQALQDALSQANLPSDAIQLINTPDRAAVGVLLTLKGLIDVIIPRGGKSLIERVSQESKIPVLKHLDGICHIYVDETASLEMALSVIDNAKTQRYGVCNALETLLVHHQIAQKLLPALANQLRTKGVELRGDSESALYIPNLIPATERDWQTEYLAPILSIRVVASLDDALNHIDHYGSGHTDAILTENWSAAQRFLREVDSSSVMVNASTRFADGFEYGLGAEIGISTDKLHARGPVGLEGLTNQKYIVYGQGQTRGTAQS